MKIKARITQTKSQSLPYNHLYIEVLTGRYNPKDSDNLETIGHISFQQTVGEDRWYGMSFEVRTDKPKYLLMMAKIGQFILDKRSNWDAQPEEIKTLLNIEEYVHYDQDFVPVSANEKFIFKVYTPNGSYHSKIYAKDSAEAVRLANKRWKQLKEYGIPTVIYLKQILL